MLCPSVDRHLKPYVYILLSWSVHQIHDRVCVILPTGYILAPSRYTILEDLGCSFAFEYTELWLAIGFAPNVLMAAATLCLQVRTNLIQPAPLSFSVGMAVRNLIRFRKSTQYCNFQSTFTQVCFVRMLVTCVIIGVWPLFATLLIFFVSNPTGRLKSWPGWTSTHKSFQDIPQIPFSRQPSELHRFYFIAIWLEIVSAYIISGVLVCTEEVRGDLGMLRNYIVDTISRYRGCRPRTGLDHLPSPPNPSLCAEV